MTDPVEEPRPLTEAELTQIANDLDYISRTLDRASRGIMGHVRVWAREDLPTLQRIISRLRSAATLDTARDAVPEPSLREALDRLAAMTWEDERVAEGVRFAVEYLDTARDAVPDLDVERLARAVHEATCQLIGCRGMEREDASHRRYVTEQAQEIATAYSTEAQP